MEVIKEMEKTVKTKPKQSPTDLLRLGETLNTHHAIAIL